jgi:hypothetical protein
MGNWASAKEGIGNFKLGIEYWKWKIENRVKRRNKKRRSFYFFPSSFFLTSVTSVTSAESESVAELPSSLSRDEFAWPQ